MSVLVIFVRNSPMESDDGNQYQTDQTILAWIIFISVCKISNFEVQTVKH